MVIRNKHVLLFRPFNETIVMEASTFFRKSALRIPPIGLQASSVHTGLPVEWSELNCRGSQPSCQVVRSLEFSGGFQIIPAKSYSLLAGDLKTGSPVATSAQIPRDLLFPRGINRRGLKSSPEWPDSGLLKTQETHVVKQMAGCFVYPSAAPGAACLMFDRLTRRAAENAWRLGAIRRANF